MLGVSPCKSDEAGRYMLSYVCSRGRGAPGKFHDDIVVSIYCNKKGLSS